MEYIQLTMDDYLKAKEEIKQDLGGIVKSFVRIGWQLTRIDASGAYRQDGYKNITEFAKAEYNMTASGVSRFMDVYDKYSVEGDTPELQERYRDFNFSQLSEMLQLSQEEREIFEPEDKREAIREYKTFQKENEADPSRLFTWQEEPQDLFGQTVKEFFRTKKELMEELYSGDAYRNWNLEEITDTVNPAGSLTFRHKTMFLAMHGYEKGISMTEFGQSPVQVSWKEFFEKMREVLGDHEENAWEEVFGQKDDQIPGQDSIENHPEYMPADTQEKPVQEAPPQAAGPEEKVLTAEQAVPDEIGPEHGFAPAQKTPQTEEQKYNAQQNQIDRETKKKLQEMEDAEKMEHLPSEIAPTVHQIRLASIFYDDAASGKKPFELRKNDRGYKEGHILEMMEFHDGRNTGRVIRAEVTYMLEDYTGLQDGYCIMGTKILSYT